MNQIVGAFSDPAHVARYTEGPPKMVPGYAGMQRMTMVLLAERVPEQGHVLVLGAGGGLELKAFAEAQPNWNLHGVDPSKEMLHLAEQVLGSLSPRITLQQGLIDDAPVGPFDGATCLLTMHFLPMEERRRAAAAVRRRLKPGSPFVVAHFSIADKEGDRSLWLSRYASFAIASGIEPEKAEMAKTGIGEKLPILTPEQDESILREAGFSHVSLFYVGFSFRGWVAYA